jgi:hypothetical protein
MAAGMDRHGSRKPEPCRGRPLDSCPDPMFGVNVTPPITGTWGAKASGGPILSGPTTLTCAGKREASRERSREALSLSMKPGGGPQRPCDASDPARVPSRGSGCVRQGGAQDSGAVARFWNDRAEITAMSCDRRL